MLLQLSIHHLALIDELTIEFSAGMNVLTGETGAGKSIVVDAVNLVLGERADRELIANGKNRAGVDAVFDISENMAVQQVLKEMEIETEEGLLSISREILGTGRNVCRVNGVILPLQMLRKISAQLLDIHGQHEHQLLLNAENHLGYLDQYDMDTIGPVRAATAECYEKWHDAALSLARFRKTTAQREQRADMLRFQMEELKGADLKDGEEQELESKRVFYRNAGRIAAAFEEADLCLAGGSGEGSSAVTMLSQAVAALSQISHLDAQYEHMHKRIEGLSYELEDAAREIETFRGQLDFDEQEAELVEERLDLLHRLERKYGTTVEEMIAYRNRIAEELSGLAHSDDEIEQLEKNYRMFGKKLRECSAVLSQKRREAARRFETEMEHQLKDLGMKNARIAFEFEESKAGERIESRFSATGTDRAEMMFCANLGQSMKPLARVASGGELSRIMLALKNLSAQKPGIPRSMVFDEIDTGISGRMAQVVAEKMTEIGDHHQVICVTHLPQIAAMADEQFLVRKYDEDGKTRTTVEHLDRQQRIEELARMVGGADSSSSSGIAHAASLLEEAEERKKELRLRIEKKEG